MHLRDVQTETDTVGAAREQDVGSGITHESNQS